MQEKKEYFFRTCEPWKSELIEKENFFILNIYQSLRGGRNVDSLYKLKYILHMNDYFLTKNNAIPYVNDKHFSFFDFANSYQNLRARVGVFVIT